MVHENKVATDFEWSELVHPGIKFRFCFVCLTVCPRYSFLQRPLKQSCSNKLSLHKRSLPHRDPQGSGASYGEPWRRIFVSAGHAHERSTSKADCSKPITSQSIGSPWSTLFHLFCLVGFSPSTPAKLLKPILLFLGRTTWQLVAYFITPSGLAHQRHSPRTPPRSFASPQRRELRSEPQCVRLS